MHTKLRDGVYSVGVQDPSLRIFDIVMYTKYGTTYNSYLVIGNEKIALIENVKYKFFNSIFRQYKRGYLTRKNRLFDNKPYRT